MKIKFPEMKTITKFGNKSPKNIISHLICKESVKDCQLMSKQRTSFVLKDDTHTEYFITSNKNNIPQKHKNVILSQIFTDEDLQLENIVLLKWIKNVNLKDYSPEEIVESWCDAFNFKQENQDNKILGLRRPQLGAIYKVLGHLTNAKDIATVVLPTGTGKTEAMMSILAANQIQLENIPNGCKSMFKIISNCSIRFLKITIS